jgi:hypothetical protein
MHPAGCRRCSASHISIVQATGSTVAYPWQRLPADHRTGDARGRRLRDFWLALRLARRKSRLQATGQISPLSAHNLYYVNYWRFLGCLRLTGLTSPSILSAGPREFPILLSASPCIGRRRLGRDDSVCQWLTAAALNALARTGGRHPSYWIHVSGGYDSHDSSSINRRTIGCGLVRGSDVSGRSGTDSVAEFASSAATRRVSRTGQGGRRLEGAERRRSGRGRGGIYGSGEGRSQVVGSLHWSGRSRWPARQACPRRILAEAGTDGGSEQRDDAARLGSPSVSAWALC